MGGTFHLLLACHSQPLLSPLFLSKAHGIPSNQRTRHTSTGAALAELHVYSQTKNTQPCGTCPSLFLESSPMRLTGHVRLTAVEAKEKKTQTPDEWGLNMGRKGGKSSKKEKWLRHSLALDPIRHMRV